MNREAILDRSGAPMTTHRSLLRHVPVVLALLAIGGIYAVVSAQFSLGPRGLLPGLIVALVALLLAAVRAGWLRLGRTVGLGTLGVVTVAEALSTSALVVGLLTSTARMSQVPHDTALALLRDAALIWLVNILTFSLWYWEIDGGGPGRRHFRGYHSADFVFPQSALDPAAASDWLPRYVDYLFLAFTASTAFSPTDTLVLSVRAKLLMMLQASISLIVLAIIAARAINTL